MLPDYPLIDENGLPEFRARALASETLYDHIPHDGSALLINLPPGVGKSHAARELAKYALASEHDLVIYVAPTRALVSDFASWSNAAGINIVELEPRPKEQCGSLNPEWIQLERNGCSALAKATLCEGCPHQSQCGWPDQLDQIAPGIEFVALTEQYLILSPRLLQTLVRNAGAVNPLVLFDEASFLGATKLRSFTKKELVTFRTALNQTTPSAPEKLEVLANWVKSIDMLLDDDVHLRDAGHFSPYELLDNVLTIQSVGQQIGGTNFRFLAHDLALLNSTVTQGQWVTGDRFEIQTRVDTKGCDVVVLGAYLEPEFVEEHLGRVVIPHDPNWKFKHSESHFINISDRNGSARTMGSKDHFNRICDFFLALILRNQILRKRTILVSRKKFRKQIKCRIEQKALELGYHIECLIMQPDDDREPKGCWQIPLINYGIIGINNLEDFDAVYCVGGYNCNVDNLNSVYQKSTPPETRLPLKIDTKNHQRIVVAGDGEFGTRSHARRAKSTLKMLEPVVALQAVGRARPFTTPVEVILFQLNEFENELAEVFTYPTLVEARAAMGIPKLAAMKKAYLSERIQRQTQDGTSIRSAARKLGIASSTAADAVKVQPLPELLKTIRIGGKNE